MVASERKTRQMQACGDAKSLLNQFVQRYIKRPVAKGDIEYKANKIPGQGFQAIVKLNCLANVENGEEAPEFAGEVSHDQKTAEKQAAYQALELYGPVMDTLAPPKSGTKRKASSSAATMPLAPIDMLGTMESAEKMARVGDVVVGTPLGTSFKGDLNSAIGKIIRRPIPPDSVKYSVTMQQGVGYVGQVNISCLPGEYGTMVHQGPPMADKKQAEQAVAQAAMEELRQVPHFQQQMDAPKVQKVWNGKGKGKGKGKNYGHFGGAGFEHSFAASSNMTPIGGGGGFDMGQFGLGAVGFQQF